MYYSNTLDHHLAKMPSEMRSLLQLHIGLNTQSANNRGIKILLLLSTLYLHHGGAVL